MALLDKILPHLPQIDQEMAALRGGIIIPELRLYATIRYLAGGSYLDICFFCGILKPSFYRCVWETIAAINKAVKIKFPSTAEECALNASDFESVSHARIISNCVGAVDGYLLGIVTPAKKHAKNVRSYFLVTTRNMVSTSKHAATLTAALLSLGLEGLVSTKIVLQSKTVALMN
jgi:hypothetical protein